MKRPFVVYSPPYSHRSGGVRALFTLVGKLNSMGERAVIADLGGRPCQDCTSDAPRLDSLDGNEHEGAIVVLPEIVRGNPSASPCVVRWLLSKPGYNPVAEYARSRGPSELHFTYSPQIDKRLPRLHVPAIDTATFTPKATRGAGYATYVGKGMRQGFDEGALDIVPGRRHAISMRQPRTARALADLLRAVDLLVSFDALSAVNLEAALCGTPVLMLGDENVWSRAEIERSELTTSSFAWSADDLPRAREASAHAYADYADDLGAFAHDIERFVEQAHAHFGPAPPVRPPRPAPLVEPIRRRAGMSGVAILVPWRGDGDHRDKVLGYVRDFYDQFDFEIVLGRMTDSEPWSKGTAVADAADRAHGDVFVIADADCVVKPASLLAAIAAVVNGPRVWAMPFTFVRRLTKLGTERLLADGGVPNPHAPIDRAQYRGVVGGGITVVRTDAYAEAPIDPRFEHWGGEDEAFGLAQACLHGPAHQEQGVLWHLWHPHAAPARAAPPASDVLLGEYRAARRLPRRMQAILAGEPVTIGLPLAEPVRFRALHPRRVIRIGDTMVRFTGNEGVFDDPDIVDVLRATPGIEEVRTIG